MREQRTLRLTLNKSEAIALIVALSEYIYLVEEGDLRGAMLEADLEDDPPLSDRDAGRLKVRLENLVY
jgi:hypothetical protein